MQETLARFRDPELDLCSMLCQLILDIRRILVQPMQNHVKLAAIAEAVDELAPATAAGRVRGVARKGTGRQRQGHLADMSLPPGQRRKHKTTRTSRVPLPAQVRHGNSPAGRRKRREGERKLDQERRC